MPALVMTHAEDPKISLLRELGDLSDVEVFNNQILVAIYLRPTETTLAGKKFYLPDKSVDEDRYQSKCGLLVKAGPNAFHDANGVWFKDANIDIGDWVVFRASDGWNITLVRQDPNTGETYKVLCKHMDDVAVRGKISNPNRVY